MSKINKDPKQPGCHVETECSLEHEGVKFTSGGSWMLRRKDTGLMEGVLYEFDGGKMLGTWDGSIKVSAFKTNIWRSNWGDKRTHYTFRWNNKRFWGINAGDNQIVRCKEYKKEE